MKSKAQKADERPYYAQLPRPKIFQLREFDEPQYPSKFISLNLKLYL